MSTKSLVWGGLAVGSTLGSMVPYLWNGGLFSFIIWGGAGGIAGIYIGFKLAKATGAL